MHDYIIDVKNLNKSFNDKPAVINTSLQVRQGEIFGFLGPNGSGKTTTIRMLCGLLKPDSGQGHCLGFDIINETLKIKLQAGYMTQHFSLYEDLSVYENLDFIARIYGMKNRKSLVKESIYELQLQDRKNQLAGTLSGGWKQRLALSAALIHQPKLLLLDEPTAGVDPKARRDFWQHIFHLSQKGITTLVSTHYMDEAERCTRLAYINQGKILTHGSAEEIIQSAKLITWQVTGPNLMALSEKLTLQPEITQVASFGQSLHICGNNEATLEKSIQQFRVSPYYWKKIEPSLEDVFISLVGKKARDANDAE